MIAQKQSTAVLFWHSDLTRLYYFSSSVRLENRWSMDKVNCKPRSRQCQGPWLEHFWYRKDISKKTWTRIVVLIVQILEFCSLSLMQHILLQIENFSVLLFCCKLTQVSKIASIHHTTSIRPFTCHRTVEDSMLRKHSVWKNNNFKCGFIFTVS